VNDAVSTYSINPNATDAEIVDFVDVVLEGGPRDFPESQRVRKAQPIDYKIKVGHRNGYEHFERAGECCHHGGTQPVVFRWTTRTSIAE